MEGPRRRGERGCRGWGWRPARAAAAAATAAAAKIGIGDYAFQAIAPATCPPARHSWGGGAGGDSPCRRGAAATGGAGRRRRSIIGGRSDIQIGIKWCLYTSKAICSTLFKQRCVRVVVTGTVGFALSPPAAPLSGEAPWMTWCSTLCRFVMSVNYCSLNSRYVRIIICFKHLTYITGTYMNKHYCH